ncbi:fasciclin domain-containing protein [Paraflavisolibacter sp. H34]|uniref:fasciclin domain-containing protein n=1 Tax=Huijunlia imazamoxiresistens TaxID=3127457 RepID=UPI0030186608
MMKYLQRGLPFLAILVLLANCRKKEWDDKYGRPESLEPPIYQVLQSRGNFTSLLALIEKGGYRETLDGSGYWTFFAPNDSAFATYFKDKGISGAAAIDSGAARALVQYLLVYNAFQQDRLDDYQATASNAGWTPNLAFRRRTAFYTGVYQDTGLNNRPLMAIANNRNADGKSLTGNYVATDYNNKHLTYFTSEYLAANSLSAADYNYFYPTTEFGGFNVAQAKVVNKDIMAENGVIHEINKVITPLMSIDEYIRTKPQYSSFRALLNRVATNNLVQFIYNADVTRRYQVLSGKGDSVFVKVYSSLLAFAPNNENYLKTEENDGQKNCWTIFIPNNQAVDEYVKNTLCEFYPSLDAMPIDIIADFLNSHLFPTAVWPTKFAVTRNNFSEAALFNPFSADIFDRQILSNGFLYGTTRVQAPEVFSSVFSKAYLNPKFTFMTRLLNTTGLKALVARTNVPVNLFLVPDQVFLNAGYKYNPANGDFTFNGSTNGVPDRLARILRTCVSFAPYNSKIDGLTDSLVVKSGDAGTEGEFIKLKRGSTRNADGSYRDTLWTAGLQDLGKAALVDSVKVGTNGRVFFLNEIPMYSEKKPGYHISLLGAATTSEYNLFWQLLKTATFFNATDFDIPGLTGFTTIFVPNNNAVKQAVKDGMLPGNLTTGAPTVNPGDTTGKSQVARFLLYHIINGRTVVPDGESSGQTETFLNPAGSPLKVTVNNSPGDLQVIDNFNRASKVILRQSNNLSNRSVIHLIDNYLKYKL